MVGRAMKREGKKIGGKREGRGNGWTRGRDRNGEGTFVWCSRSGKE